MEHNKPIQRTAYQLTLSRGQSREKREQGRKYHSPVLANRIRLHVSDYYHDVSDKVVFLRGSDFEAIFQSKSANYSSRNRIVKVLNPQTRRYIYREYRCGNEDVRNMNDYALLSYNSLMQLAGNEDEFNSINKVYLTKSSLWGYLSYQMFVNGSAVLWSIFSILIAIVLCIIPLLISCM